MSKVPVESYLTCPEDWVEVEYMGTYDINSDKFSLVFLNSVKDKDRQISFVTGREYAKMMELRKRGMRFGARMLPIDIVYDFMRSYGDPEQYFAYVDYYNDGVFYTYLRNGVDGLNFKLKLSDAMHLHLGYGVKVFFKKELFDHIATNYMERMNKVGLPAQMLPLEVLKKALDDRIAEERFEEAKQIKEEIERRNPSETTSLN